MEVKIQQWGNSAAIRLPSTVLKQMSLASGDVLLLNVDAAAEAMTLKPAKVKPRYQLADLMAQCDLNAAEPAELAAWNSMPAVGREV
ncbi:AbrB/MazE/SpoVT family DNA-binding domain-containing protein [Pseudomonas sp. P66]|uniref:AbrB/MazE/SpoVT family DNA-binding domain-containing protein n=1 Tax=Pseudomonas arcuscaelestis TaxID=2710591 RepID=A0ABS2BZR0_9PSED|nr:AbrB/MazE/SpoVT family DNA-binding domain-containing protein [Pseudomonas arcuscaelestis]MBM5459084.1 AbrB/MazE/SpoVT family DNA-binding domain-containing protein [Pseudomonas arcuscaelestis]